VNQIVAAVAIFGIVTAVFAPLIGQTGMQIFSSSVSISDTMESSMRKTGQVLVATHIQRDGGGETVTVYVSNIGTNGVGLRAALVDGTESALRIYDQDMQATDMLAPGQLGMVQITGSGDTVHLVTDAGKLFGFDIIT